MKKLIFVFPLLLAAARHDAPTPKQESHLLPRYFEANRGQASQPVRYLTREPGYTAFFLDGEVSFVFPQLRPAPLEPPLSLQPPRHAEPLKDEVMRMRWLGGRAARPLAGDPQTSVSNYYIGNDPARWHAGVPHFGELLYRGIYDGVDLTFNRPNRRLAYRFDVAPGADPSQIRLSLDGKKHLDANGDLINGAVRMTRPRAWQGGAPVDCRFVIQPGGIVAFALGKFDPMKPLVIDPEIEYLTYLGGNTYDAAASVAVDRQGALYVTGYLQSPQYPVLDPFQQATGSILDVFVAKLAPSGNRLVYYAYLGGSNMEASNAIAVDQALDVYVAGWTSSPDFGLRNPAQSVFGGGFENAFLAKLNGQGKLTFATYLGGSYVERANALVVDAAGAMYVSGYSYSGDFPVKNAFQPRSASRPDTFLAKLAPDGSRFEFATHFGGTGQDVSSALALDRDKNIYLGGFTTSIDLPVTPGVVQSTHRGREGTGTMFVAKFSPAADKLLASTYFGGTSTSSISSMQVDGDGALWMLGMVSSDGFPTKNPVQAKNAGKTDAAVVCLTGDLREVRYSTLLGGSEDDHTASLVIDANGSIVFTGSTYSSDFPVRDSLFPFRGALSGYKRDGFVVKLAPGGSSIVYSTLIAGNGSDATGGIALDKDGAIYYGATSGSDDLPVKNPLQAAYAGGGQDMVLLKLKPEPPGVPPVLLVVAPAIVPFEAIAGQADPAAQLVMVGATIVRAYSARVQLESGSGWLRVTPETGSAPGTLRLTVSAAGLPPGTYRASVILESGGSAQTVAVTFRLFSATPRMTALDPPVIPARSDETSVLVRGSGFLPGAVVLLSTTPLPTQYIDANTLRINLGRATLTDELTFPLSVMNPQSKPSEPLLMTVGRPLPQIFYNGVTNGASYEPRTISPGLLVTIFGARIGPEKLAAASIGADGRIVSELAETRVLFDGIAAPLVYVSETQTSAIVPFAIAGKRTVEMQVEYRGQRSPAQVLPVRDTAPGLFTADASGRGLAAAPPVNRGSVVVLYATGAGLLEPQLADGEIAGAVLSRTRQAVKVFIDGMESEVLYAGSAPGLAAGILQVNVRVPEFAVNGEVVLRLGDAESQPDVFLTLKD